MLRASWCVLATLTVASLLPGAAAADEVDPAAEEGFDPDRALRSVALGLDGAELTAAVSYQVRTTGPQVVDVDLGLGLPLPAGATMVGAQLAEGASRREARRTAADAALAEVTAIDEAAPARRRRGYLLVSVDVADQVSVRLGLPDAGRRTLTLRVRAPTCVLDDHRWAALPTAWTERLRRVPGLRQASASESSRLHTACLSPATWTDPPGDHVDRPGLTWVGLPDPALRRLRADPARTQITVEQLGDDRRQLGRMELALGRALTPMPVAPHVVVLLDASRSLDDADWDAQRALLDAFLARAPRGTRVAVRAYTRTSRPVLPGWVEAGAARRSVGRALAGLVRGNGSEVSAAVAEAGRLLAGVAGERRVLLVSDQLLRQREQVRAAELHQRLPAGVRLITVDVRGGELLVRDDASRFAATTAATGGIAMTSEDGPSWADPTPFDATALWRPTSLDRISIDAAGWSELAEPPGPAACGGLRRDDDHGFDLREGTACWWWATRADRTAAPIHVRGLLWNQPWTGRAVPIQGGALARQLGTTPPRADLAPLWRRAADAGDHVTPGWSLLLTWGSGGGYGDQASITGGTTCDCRDPGDIGFGHGRARPRRELEPLVRAAVAPCLVPGVALTISLETTRSELVAVDVAARGVDWSSHLVGADVATCAEAALWAAPLDFDGDDHAAPTFTIEASR